MKIEIIGAQAKYEVGNRTETLVFNEVFSCASLKDKPVVTAFRGISREIPHGKEIYCPREFIEWAMNDAMSPFAKDHSFVVAWDKPLDIKAARQDHESKVKVEAQEKVLPDGLPESEWKPKQLMDLYRALDAKEIPEQQFIMATPPSKARLLRDYMVKKHITVKGGSIIKEASAA